MPQESYWAAETATNTPEAVNPTLFSVGRLVSGAGANKFLITDANGFLTTAASNSFSIGPSGVSINGNLSDTYALAVYNERTNELVRGIYSQSTLNHSSSSNLNNYGGFFTTTNNISGTGASTAYSLASTTNSYVVSGVSNPGNFFSLLANGDIVNPLHQGTIANTFGVYTTHGLNTGVAGNITNSFGLRVVTNLLGTGTINNYFQLYLNKQGTTTNVTGTRYGIYQNDTDATNFFGGTLQFGGTNHTASRVAVLDANRFLTSSTVTTTELGYLSGVTSAIQTQINTKLTASNNLSDLTNAATARTNLGLGTAAQLASGTFATSGHTHTDFLVKASNLSDLTNTTTARTNLGIGLSDSPTFTGLTLSLGEGPVESTTTGVLRKSNQYPGNLVPSIESSNGWSITGSGSFVATGGPNQTFAIELATTAAGFNTSSTRRIPVDILTDYEFNIQVLGTNTAGSVFIGFQPYDAQGNVISSHQVACPTNTLTTLAADLNPGDTTVTLTSSTNWNAATPTSRLIGFSPVSSLYNVHGGYTRFVGNSVNHTSTPSTASGDYTAVSGNVLTLATPWVGPAYAAGTPVGNYRFSNTAIFPAGTTSLTTSWNRISRTIRRGPASGQAGTDLGRWWPGTVSVVFRASTSATTAPVRFSQPFFYRSARIGLGDASLPSWPIQRDDQVLSNTGFYWDTASTTLRYSNVGTATLAFGPHTGQALNVLSGELRITPLAGTGWVRTDADGDLTKYVPAVTYTVSNPSTSRSIDVNNASLSELRAFVGTLVSDLKSIGILL